MTQQTQKQIIILAAGKGSRMKSSTPKLLHLFHGKPMIDHVIDNCRKVTNDLFLIYSDHIKQHLDLIQDKVKLIKQQEQLGTAHAAYMAIDHIDHSKNHAVVLGDNPLITSDIINNLFDSLHKTKAACITLVFEYNKPNQYGKIITDKNGQFLSIIEHKYATEDQKKISLCNSGVMVFAPGILEKYLKYCLVKDANKPEKELYLTDMIAVLNQYNEKISFHIADNPELVIGINTQDELVNAHKINNLC